MRRKSIFLVTSAGLAISLLGTLPAYAQIQPQAFDRICAEWRFTLGKLPESLHAPRYPGYTQTCLRWIRLKAPLDPSIFRPGPRSLWLTYTEWNALNPQPLPPRAKHAKSKHAKAKSR